MTNHPDSEQKFKPEDFKLSRSIPNDLLLPAKTALLNARVAGMIAENQDRQHLGLPPVYLERDFLKLTEFEFLHEHTKDFK